MADPIEKAMWDRISNRYQEKKQLDDDLKYCGHIERNILLAERDAIDAELDYLHAQFRIIIYNRSIAEAYEQYGGLDLKPETYHRLLVDAAGDVDYWRETKAALDTILNPQDVTKKHSSLTRSVSQSDQEWMLKLDVWEEKHRSWVARNQKEDTQVIKIIAIRLVGGRLRIEEHRTDGSWSYIDSLSRLPSGIYVSRSTEWSSVLAELEDLINDPGVQESNLQEFFESYPELLLGTDYDTIIPQACIVKNDRQLWRADFVLHPFDHAFFSKVLEIKLPNAPIERERKTGHTRFYNRLYLAINQVLDYSEALTNKYAQSRFYEIYKTEIYRPEAQLIIGRRESIKNMHNLKNLGSRYHVQITDWDTHVEKLKELFK